MLHIVSYCAENVVTLKWGSKVTHCYPKISRTKLDSWSRSQRSVKSNADLLTEFSRKTALCNVCVFTINSKCRL